jgi:hypothetical protein
MPALAWIVNFLSLTKRPRYGTILLEDEARSDDSGRDLSVIRMPYLPARVSPSGGLSLWLGQIRKGKCRGLDFGHGFITL